jgi:hypothetical protein
MTKREREQVVELLRVAADTRGIGDARQALRLPWLGRIHSLSLNAISGAGKPRRGWRWLCLEAAARVEEGSWP